ncbi:MAG TPA: hypothetical protein VEI03_10100 [Stellaceae bacterium]|nr:hypothetical protein [Stellaceae bacterium]
MQIAGQQYPWMWQFNGPGGTTSSGQASQGSGSAGSPSDCTGASAADGGVQQFEAMIQAMIQQLQSGAGANAGSSGAASTSSSTDATGTTSTGDAQTTASAGATSTSADASAGSTDQVGGHYHHHHHHHWNGADGQDQTLSSSDLTTLQNDANSLVSALFGVLQSSNGTASAATAATATDAASGATATTASTGTGTAGASTSSSTTDTSGAAPWQTIAATFAQDLLNAAQAYAAQNNNATAANLNPAASAVA